MAKLICSDDNQNPASRVSLELDLGETFSGKNFENQSTKELWRRFTVKLQRGEQELCFDTNNKVASEVKGLFCVNISPANEIEQLCENLQKFLDNENHKLFVFETIEPSFELRIERSHQAFKAYAWVDAGNTSTIIYTWDALGIRFMTDRNKITSFISELKDQL